jgi:hypothetical protein
MVEQKSEFDYYSVEMFELRGVRARLIDWPRCNKGQSAPQKDRDEYNERLQLLGISFKTPGEEAQFWEEDNERMSKFMIF